ncbi:hypothetical protein PspLS_11379 [Pyricularia sp. CBS 133598]|nr:hypothetical protein PspLS_11379 [Pyricularia sp. CBS 133598]
MFSLKTVVLALAAAAFVQAIPAPGEGPSVSMAQQKCGSEKVVSCCNSKELKNSKSGAEIPIDVLSGECKNIPINILTINQLIPINNFCSDTVSCCSGEQIGLVNIQDACDHEGMMVVEDVWSFCEGAGVRRSAMSESRSWLLGALVSS